MKIKNPFCSIFLIACLFLSFLSFPKHSFAAGSITQTLLAIGSPRPGAYILRISWTGDAGDGTVPSSCTNAEILGIIQGWSIYYVKTIPGTPNPSTLWDVVINDINGFDLMGGTLADRSATVVQRAVPKIDMANVLYGSAVILDNICVVVTGNSVNSVQGTIDIVLIPPR